MKSIKSLVDKLLEKGKFATHANCETRFVTSYVISIVVHGNGSLVLTKLAAVVQLSTRTLSLLLVIAVMPSRTATMPTTCLSLPSTNLIATPFPVMKLKSHQSNLFSIQTTAQKQSKMIFVFYRLQKKSISKTKISLQHVSPRADS